MSLSFGSWRSREGSDDARLEDKGGSEGIGRGGAVEDDGYGRVRDDAGELRTAEPKEPVTRFKTPPEHQDQVDFGEFRVDMVGQCLY